MKVLRSWSASWRFVATMGSSRGFVVVLPTPRRKGQLEINTLPRILGIRTAHPNPGCSRGLNPPVSSRDLAM